jgi:hypothetical protein
MAGPRIKSEDDPAIHADPQVRCRRTRVEQDGACSPSIVRPDRVDARVKPGHDEKRSECAAFP